MAAAGFYLVSTPDSVRCFVCLKELDGWEPEDDPIEEHRNHSKKCPFLKIIKKKEASKMTVEEFFKLNYVSHLYALDALLDSFIVNYDRKLKESTNEIKNMMN